MDDKVIDIPILTVAKGNINCDIAEKILIKKDIFYMKTFASKECTKTLPILNIGEYEYEGLSGIMSFIYGKKGWI